MAVEKGEIEIVKLFLQNKDLDINFVIKRFSYGKSYDTYTALYKAIIIKNNTLAKLLLSNDKIDPSIPYKSVSVYKNKKKIDSSITPFFAAVENHNIEIINILLSNKNIDIDCRCNKMTPLFCALIHNYIDVVKILLQNSEKLDINVLNAREITKYDRGTSCRFKDNKTYLYYAAETNNVEMVKLLLTIKNIDVNKISMHDTYSYCKVYNHYEDCRIRAKEMTALYVAAKNGSTDVVKLLLSNENIDVNIINVEREIDQFIVEKTALCAAIEYNNNDIVELLLSNKNIDVNILDKKRSHDKSKSEKSALHIAVENNNIDAVKLLLENGNIDVNRLLKFEEKGYWSIETISFCIIS